MSGALVSPDLFTLCKVLITGIMKIQSDAILAGAPVGSPVEPLRGVAYFLMEDWFLTLNAWMIAITIMVTWAAAIQLLTLMWMERKFYSRLQDRYGIMISIWSLPFWPFSWWAQRRNKPTHRGLGYLQNVADGVKLLQKENITPANADSAMFHTAPVLIASSTVMIFAALPFSEGFVIANMPMSLLFILAAFSLAPLGILIAGWASNNKYSLIGGMRAAAQLMAYEIPLLLAVIAVLVYAGTLNVIDIVAKQETLLASVGPIPIPNWNVFSIPQFIGFAVFATAMMAEMERIPFDIPEAEAELVEGWLTEYSGMRFGLVFGFKWMRALAGSALVVILYFGGWSGPVFVTLTPSVGGTVVPIPIPPHEVWFLLKVYFLYLVFVWVSWSVPRVRIDQILNIGWKRLIPLALLAILLAASFVALGPALGGIR
ncbi:MAG: NADH-quinone oxidoreductase subunit H [Methanobacteriota archaeon]|nr:MAG: NADH-quinone oxidoreductase subunit H [Euryarchaeota archaeon]